PCNEWGSDQKGGRGKACSQRKLFFIYLPGDTLPRVLSAPPSSLKMADKYLMRLLNNGRKYWEVVTKVTLAKRQNGAGIAYSELSFAQAGMLSAEQVETMDAQKGVLAALLSTSTQEIIQREATGVAEEYKANAEADANKETAA
ncbi:MAG: hypothetical protein PHT33_05595, partial [bacterium]|nr:hypothetical protein [bacterium]